MNSITQSLKNLNLSFLFGLLLHDSKILYNWIDEDSNTVEELVNTGKIKYFGVSIYTSKDFELAIKNEKIRFIQVPFNLFDQRAYKEKWFELARENNKLIFIRSIFLQGLLLMDIDKVPPKLESAKKYIEIVKEYANKLGITRNELALSFVDNVAMDSLLLFGCDNLEQATENIKNYNSIKKIDDIILNEIISKLSDIDEQIYNPIKW
jgi:aryl-alcohol dehydrogenase-like predicted oxidoreductase